MDLSLFSALRPGSRTVLCHPDSPELVMELARRGFRLMLVHEDDDFVQKLRAGLRASGLSSSLMGAARSKVGQVPSLAKGFYELVLLCPRARLSPAQMKFALDTGGLLVQPVSQGEVQWDGYQPVSMPDGFVAGRVV